jgi:hypothetical protein
MLVRALLSSSTQIRRRLREVLMVRAGLFAFLSILIGAAGGCSTTHSPQDDSGVGTGDPELRVPAARCAPTCQPTTFVPAGFARDAEDSVCRLDCNWCVCTESGPQYCTAIFCPPDAGSPDAG